MRSSSTLCALVLLALPVVADAQPATGWTEVVLPGGRAGLLPALGLRPDVPRALAVGAIIRTVHESRDPADRARAALAGYLASPPEGEELVPIPLDADVWQKELLPREVPDRQLLGAILANRSLALLCYGLLALDAETLAWVGDRPDLLRRIRDRYAGVFAAFASAVQIRAGALVLPGGDAMRPVWEDLGVPADDDTSERVEALLRADEGRLAYFAATLHGIDAARLQFLTGDSSLPPERRESLVDAAYATFRAVDPRRLVNEFPFTRPAWDSALLAGSIAVNAYGHLAGPRALWRTALAPRTGTDGRPAPPDPGTPDAGWVLQQIASLHRQERQERFESIFYLQRQQWQRPDASWQELATLTRGFRRFPALMLTLERMDLADASLHTTAIEQAAALSHLAGDAAVRDRSLALFQAPIVLLDTVLRRGAITSAVAESLLRTLLEIESGPGQARRLAVWIETALLPAIGHDPSITGVPRESVLLEALAGFGGDRSSSSPPEIVEWEGASYRIDPAAPELIRLADIRTEQGGNTLDLALDLARIGTALATVSTPAQVQEAAAGLDALGGRLLPIQPSELPGMPAPPLVPQAIDQALEDLGQGRAGLDRARAVAAGLAPVEDAVLADVLSSIVYALALGPADSRLFLAGNVARRHDYGTRDRTPEVGARTPWVIPREESGAGAPWHVRGSLLALDVGLAHLRMRPTRMDLPDGQPTFSHMDRWSLTATLVFMDALSPDVQGARRLLEWLRAGRRVLADPLSPDDVNAIAERLALGGRRRAALAWTAAKEPSQVTELMMLGEIALLGRPAGDPMPDGWGMAQTLFTGCLCGEIPDPPALHRYLGRAADGLLPTRSPELTIAVLEGLFDLGLPATLAHGVLPLALYDFFFEAGLAHPGDWWSYSKQAKTLSRERLVDYVSALTAGGPLVPAAPADGSRQ